MAVLCPRRASALFAVAVCTVHSALSLARGSLPRAGTGHSRANVLGLGDVTAPAPVRAARSDLVGYYTAHKYAHSGIQMHTLGMVAEWRTASTDG
ncbi:hypothetical protein C8Q80DRAFT_639008 [Daedaleopsis nitida]|nr:hypothetical protein C8Q80DRAFT_639008 [Daedaleopsis nitida]